jgi:hypothetical protein
LEKEFDDVELVEDKLIDEIKELFAGTLPLFFSGSHRYIFSKPTFNPSGDLCFDLFYSVDRQETNTLESSVVSATEKLGMC